MSDTEAMRLASAVRRTAPGGGWRTLLTYKIELLILAILALTATALHYQDRILDRHQVFTRDGSIPFHSYSYSDSVIGGHSVVSPDPARRLSWSCDLRDGPLRYCGFGVEFDVSGKGKGLNLSPIRSVTVDLDYHGPEDKLTFYLKNVDHRYSVRGRPDTDKFNKLDFSVRQGHQRVELPISDFNVPDWWIGSNKVPRTLAEPQFDNIVSLEVTTSNPPPLGHYRVAIRRVSFNRSIVSREVWHGLLFGVWALLIGAYLIGRRCNELKRQRLRQKRWQKTLDTIPHMVWACTSAGEEYFNAQWREFTGVQPGGADGVSRFDLIHPDDRETVKALWEQSGFTGEPYETQYRLQHRDGGHRWVLSRGLCDSETGKALRWYGTCTDIHQQVLASQALDASENLNRGIIDAIPDSVSLVDLNGCSIFANGPAARNRRGATGLAPGHDFFLAAFPRETRPKAVAAFNRARNGLIGRLASRDEDGRWWDTVMAPVFDKQGAPWRIVVVSRDVTEQKNAEEKAQWSANHDSLTQLPNRMMLQKRIDQTIATGSRFALLLFDVDDFKLINDSAGHDAGDALLCAVGQRLAGAIGEHDLVARLGGDEFAIVLNLAGEEDRRLDEALERIVEGLREPCVHKGHVLDCRTSIGISFFPDDGINRARLLKNADVALYAAKNGGKGSHRLFKPEMRTELQKRSSMISLAKSALADKGILPYYQPKLDLRSGKLDGFEALLRWRHPRSGVQPPASIAAAFEDHTLAAAMSDEIVECVIRDIRTWQQAGVPFGHVAINAAAAEFRRGDFADRLLERLRAGGVPTSAIQVEVTETVFLGRGAEYVERALRLLNQEGVRIALDDFGTGYASLSHLKDFPVSTIKIDRTFVKELEDSRDHASIIDAVINLGRSLDIEVVAEGVESAVQHHFLVARGCDYGQGHLYSPAVPAEEAAAFASKAAADGHHGLTTAAA